MGDPQYGYPDANQGYSDNRLNNQPVYPGQPVSPQQPPANVLYVMDNTGGGQYCPVCNANTHSFVTRGIGNITWIWCVVLLFFTGICCWIPFVCDSCK
jgi:hypothetical protein